MPSICRRQFVSMIFGALLLTTGCQDRAAIVEEDGAKAQLKNQLAEVSEVILTHSNTTKKAPQSAKDLAKYLNGWPVGVKAVESGDVVVEWGAKVDQGQSGNVLAYEKNAPTAGGLVLMQDGRTIKQMTKEEFQAAPKAAK